MCKKREKGGVRRGKRGNKEQRKMCKVFVEGGPLCTK